jgi:hypothetical protein
MTKHNPLNNNPARWVTYTWFCLAVALHIFCVRTPEYTKPVFSYGLGPKEILFDGDNYS